MKITLNDGSSIEKRYGEKINHGVTSIKIDWCEMEGRNHTVNTYDYFKMLIKHVNKIEIVSG